MICKLLGEHFVGHDVDDSVKTTYHGRSLFSDTGRMRGRETETVGGRRENKRGQEEGERLRHTKRHREGEVKR